MEEFVRRTNMDGYTRQWPPIPGGGTPENRGLVNEAGFLLFKSVANLPPPDVGAALRDNLPAAVRAAYAYIVGKQEATDEPNFAVGERREAVVIAGRLYNYFCRERDLYGMTVGPRFKGSGLLSGCEGDVLLGDRILYEVKSGDRPFRSVDFRQVAVYVALSFAELGAVFERIGVVNPRRGTFVEVSTEDFSLEVAGQSAVTLCHALIESFSSNLVSV
jgi:hypothetical protein